MRNNRTAFTLIELLVVVAIIAVLIAILLPSLGKARRTARQAAASSAIRQLLIGYTLYHQEFSGGLMWGYPPAYVNGQLLTVTLPGGQTIPGPGSFGGSLSILRYPARMAPYQQNVWRTMYQHSEMPVAPPTADDSVAQASQKAYVLSISPSFGLNSIFLGGDYSMGGFSGPPSYAPNGSYGAVFRAGDVRRPADMIVFLEVKHRNLSSGLVSGEGGYFRALPPMAGGRKWKAGGDRAEILDNGDVGLPEGRSTTRIVTAFFDGHVEAMRANDLDNMRLWCSKADGPQDDLIH